MSLSRHFYALDEVHAALQYCSTRNDRHETVFWCYELLRSGCVAETISTLFEAWLWNKGPFCLSWMSVAQHLTSDEVSEDDILLAAYQLSWVPHTRRDHSLWNILVHTAEGGLPERVTLKTPPYVPSHDENEMYMIRAIFQGKAYSAWWMSRHLSDARVWELVRWYVIYNYPTYAEQYLSYFTILEQYETLLGYRSDEYDTIIRCLAVLSVCLNGEQQEKSWSILPCVIEPRLQTACSDWEAEIGRKQQRRYTIPSACLYGRCRRGRMKWAESTVSQLGALEKWFIGCPFWEEAVAEYQLDNKWRSDDAREAFYDRYLVDDIPDEWSKAEKQKSHGDGLLGPTQSVRLAVYSRRFGMARLLWNAGPTVQAFLEKKEGCDPLDVIRWFPEPGVITSTLLRPIRRCVCL
jgi:hypothetical protein